MEITLNIPTGEVESLARGVVTKLVHYPTAYIVLNPYGGIQVYDNAKFEGFSLAVIQRGNKPINFQTSLIKPEDEATIKRIVHGD